MKRRLALIALSVLSLGLRGEDGAFVMHAIAHRGLHGPGVAQNSVESFRRAFAAGAKWIETDFHLLKNGRILCVHDAGELRRVACEDRDRIIADLTEADVASIDIGAAAKTPSPVRMPYLEDVLAVVPKDALAQCEIKLYGPTFADTFDAARRRAGLSETNILVSSFRLDALKDFRSRYPKYRTLWLGARVDGRTKPDLDRVLAEAKDARVDIICPGGHPAERTLTPADADRIRTAGFDFRLFGVNSPKLIAYALSMKATAFTTDRWHDAFKWAKPIKGLRLTGDAL